MFKKAIILFLVLFNINANNPKEIETLNVNIEYILTAGYWANKDNEGTFRLISVIKGWENLKNNLYIQWIKTDPEKKKNIIIQTLPVKEINNDMWRITHIKSRLLKGKWIFKLNLLNTYSNKKSVARIHPHTPGTYKFTLIK